MAGDRAGSVWFGDLDQALHFLWTAKFSIDDLAGSVDGGAREILRDATASVTRAIETLGSLLAPSDLQGDPLAVPDDEHGGRPPSGRRLGVAGQASSALGP